MPTHQKKKKIDNNFQCTENTKSHSCVSFSAFFTDATACWPLERDALLSSSSSSTSSRALEPLERHARQHCEQMSFPTHLHGRRCKPPQCRLLSRVSHPFSQGAALPSRSSSPNHLPNRSAERVPSPAFRQTDLVKELSGIFVRFSQPVGLARLLVAPPPPTLPHRRQWTAARTAEGSDWI